MTQPGLFDINGLAAEQQTAVHFVDCRPDLFRKDFKDWLIANWHIWKVFEREANRMAKRGRDHYSARTIIHWIRHETCVAEKDGDFKVNNNYSPDLGRLWVCYHPDRADFFETRERKAA